MITISILALQNASLASIADSRYVFATVNEFLKQSGQSPMFNIQLVGVSKEVKLSDGLFSLHTDFILKDAIQADLFIYSFYVWQYDYRDFVAWISDQYKNEPK